VTKSKTIRLIIRSIIQSFAKAEIQMSFFCKLLYFYALVTNPLFSLDINLAVYRDVKKHVLFASEIFHKLFQYLLCSL